jgi:uncharacterized coiled-coil DUF342 family protein
MLGILIPVQEYREIRAKYLETKAKQRALHEKVAKLKEKNAPLHAELKSVFYFGEMSTAETSRLQETFGQA